METATTFATNGRSRPPTNTKRTPRVLAALSIALLGGSSLASAQTTVLPDLIVTSATLVATPLAQIPNSVTVITAQDMEQQQLRTVPDALKTVPGLNVVQSGGPGGPYVGVHPRHQLHATPRSSSTASTSAIPAR